MGNRYTAAVFIKSVNPFDEMMDEAIAQRISPSGPPCSAHGGQANSDTKRYAGPRNIIELPVRAEGAWRFLTS